MKWTLGLLLLGAVGCGYRQTKMVACPETGCAPSYATSSPQGLPAPRHAAYPTATEEALPPVQPMAPLPDNAPPPPEPPPATP